MKKYLKKAFPMQEPRATLLARYIIENKATVREAAVAFSVSKSTVHKDVTTRLSKTNPYLCLQVNEILQYNKALRHLRGGEATRKKYSKTKGEKNNAAHQCKNDEGKKRAAEKRTRSCS